MLAGSGVIVVDVIVAVKSPDCEVVMLFPEVKSAGVHVPLGQKYSWISSGVGAVSPAGFPVSVAVNVPEKPPM